MKISEVIQIDDNINLYLKTYKVQISRKRRVGNNTFQGMVFLYTIQILEIMKWLGRRASDNVDDNRGMVGKLALGGGLGTIILIVISMLTGPNPLQYLNQVSDTPTEQIAIDSNDKEADFVKVMLADTEDVWNKIFQDQLNANYELPQLVLFTGSVKSGCGSANASTGPFYCLLDSKVYIDLDFYSDLKNRFNASGDFAMAYVIAHEVGHHVQHLLGISDKVRQKKEQLSEVEANQLSIKMELQADFLAGVWAHHNDKMKGVLEDRDIKAALNAANAIGDDKLQQESQGRVVPDAFTHGTSAQRLYWFKKGYETGDIREGETFKKEL